MIWREEGTERCDKSRRVHPWVPKHGEKRRFDYTWERVKSRPLTTAQNGRLVILVAAFFRYFSLAASTCVMYDGACPYDGYWPGSRPAVFAIIIWLLFCRRPSGGRPLLCRREGGIDCTCCCCAAAEAASWAARYFRVRPCASNSRDCADATSIVAAEDGAAPACGCGWGGSDGAALPPRGPPIFDAFGIPRPIFMRGLNGGAASIK